MTEGRRDWLGRCLPASLLHRVVVADRDDLLDGADRESLRYDPLGQPFLSLGVIKGEQRPRVSRTDHAGRDPLLYRGRQVQQPERVADVRAGTADLLRELLVRGAEVVE